MTTSANVIDYKIIDSDCNEVGNHHYHVLCKTHWDKLLKFVPMENYRIYRTYYDEDEEYFEDESVNLKRVLKK